MRHEGIFDGYNTLGSYAKAFDEMFDAQGNDVATASEKSLLVALFRRTPFARILSVEHRAGDRLDGDSTREYGDSALTFCHAP